MKILSKIHCWLFGHDFIQESRIDNGSSQYGNYMCIRCGKEHHWQYDYMT